MSAPSNGSAGGSHKRVKYTEQPFAQTNTATANQQTQSPLFGLPVKVRAKIFDLCHSTTTAQSVDIRIALHDAKHHDTYDVHRDAFAPPSTALLRTCRRAREECQQHFDIAFAAYWEKEFIISMYDDPLMCVTQDWVPNKFLARIRNYKIMLPSRYGPVAFTSRFKTDGRWYVEAVRGPDPDEECMNHLGRSLADAASAVYSARDRTLQQGKSDVGPFEAFTREGLGLLLRAATECLR